VSNLFSCLLCGISGPTEVVSPTLRDDASSFFKVVRCLTCGHVQLSPLPSLEENTAFYQADDQTRRLMGETDFAVWQSKTAADTARRVNWLRSLLPDKGGQEGILDIGCGYGFFVDTLAQMGYQATGLDVSQGRLDLARTHLRGTFIRSTVNDAFVDSHRNGFRAVAMFHVLEHVRKPVTFLQQCFELVSQGGWLLIEVPNLNDEMLDYQAEYRAFFRPVQLGHRF
jgi:2-polyprenyl-3-methyl-5-hydroxy-6-metoxy-1,4-benzoquinol methylase